MNSALPFLLFVASVPAFADLRYARELLREDPARAQAHLGELLAKTPEDPWLLYNAGVAAYAAKDFAKADEAWQQLAASPMPDALREQVWLQIGNVSYRLVQPQIESAPDATVARLEQSREAFRVTLALNKRHKTAAQNLRLVEQELEKVYARLAKQLVEQAKKETGNREKTIERLEAALTYAQQAQALNPESEERALQRREIEQLLAEAHNRKAEAHEKTADQRNQENQWERQNAQEELQKALENFQHAQAAVPDDATAKAGEQRVQEKLADSFAKAGRKEQRQGEKAARNEPEEAAENFQNALENFQEALAQMPEHADAQAGEREVKAQLEQLHLQQGDRQAQRGETQLHREPQQAAENLLGALEHFEQAQTIAPENVEIQPRIDKVQGQLAPLLTQLGQQEQRRGEQAEQRNAPENAIAHLEKAEGSFEKAQQFAPGNEPAKEGQQQVQEALSRLRQQLAQRAEKEPGKPQKGQDPQEAKETFESMLAKVKAEQPPIEVHARHRAGERYEEERNKTLRNW